MPGDEPSNGRVREPVTIRNGSICTQKHVYEHPWETVVAAYATAQHSTAQHSMSARAHATPLQNHTVRTARARH